MSQKISSYIGAWVVITMPVWMMLGKPNQASESRTYRASGAGVTKVVQEYLAENRWKEGDSSVTSDNSYVFKRFDRVGKAFVMPDTVRLILVPSKTRQRCVDVAVEVATYWSPPSDIKYNILDRLDARWKQIK